VQRFVRLNRCANALQSFVLKSDKIAVTFTSNANPLRIIDALLTYKESIWWQQLIARENARKWT